MHDALAREIRERGAIPFARFMELALYAPVYGYYERGLGQTGRRGDFYTSVSVGPVLGFLLAHWAVRGADESEVLDIVEAGAHDGALAADILGTVDVCFPGRRDRVRYRILEPSEMRRAAQRRRLAEWGGRVRWHSGWEDLGGPVRGVILSNELLDAMPVHRLGWDRRQRRWYEWGVTQRHGLLAWVRTEPDESLLPAAVRALEDVLPEAYVVESVPKAVAWWRAAARALEKGRLLALDYGWDEAGAIQPERTRGTLRAYSGHRAVEDLLANPGEQDLTAHVDFPALIQAGEEEGLGTNALEPQGRWLSRIAAEVISDGGTSAAWLTARARGLQTLVHPDHLGHALKALEQRRGV